MDEYVVALLKVSAVSSMRHDDIVSRQGVMNHQTSAHFVDMLFARDAVEMSIPESYAIQGLAAGQLPAQTAGLNASHATPSSAPSATASGQKAAA
jgi:hypothetical protein